MTVKFAPINRNGYRIPVAELSRKDLNLLMALDAYDDEEKDPEGTNSARAVQGAASANKPMHFSKGGIENNYFPNDPAEDDDLDELPDEVVESLLDHSRERGCSDDLIEKLHMRLRGQAQDEPPDNASGGQPQRGGTMSPLKAGRQLAGGVKAMDARRVGTFADQFPEAARISGDRMTNKRDVVPPQLALDRAKRRAGGKSFAERWPEANRVKHCY